MCALVARGAFGWRRALARVCAGGAVAVAAAMLLVVAAPPLELDPSEVEAELSEALGQAVELQQASWALTPQPELRLRGVAAEPLLLGAFPAEVRVERAALTGVARSGERRDAAPPEAVRLDGVRLRAGPLVLEQGRFELERTPDGLRVQGRAFGSLGGWVDVAGTFAGRGDPPSPVRIYLDDLRIRSPLPDALADTSRYHHLAISGLVTLHATGLEAGDVELDLSIVGVRSEERGEWLSLSVTGHLPRREGRFLPSGRLRYHGELRDVGGVDPLRVLSGVVQGSVAVSGDVHSPRLSTRADLSGLRIRLGEWFEKRRGVPARITAAVRLGAQGMSRAQAELILRHARLRVERDARDPSRRWHIRSGWVPVDLVRLHTPLLRHLTSDLGGRGRVRMAWVPEEDPRARLELRDLDGTVQGCAVHSDELTVDLETDGVSVAAKGLGIGGQQLALEGSARWPPAPQPIRIQLRGRAGELDVAALGEALLPLFSRGSHAPPGDDREEIVRDLVELLRSRPLLLDRLRVEPAILYAERLRGFGLDARHVEVHTVLVDRQLRLEHSDRTTGGEPRIFAVDLARWVPRVEECALADRSCGSVAGAP